MPVDIAEALAVAGDFADLVGVIGILVIIFGFLAFLRYINYKETLALAEKGLTKPEVKSRKGLLRWGIVVTSIGCSGGRSPK